MGLFYLVIDVWGLEMLGLPAGRHRSQPDHDLHGGTVHRFRWIVENWLPPRPDPSASVALLGELVLAWLLVLRHVSKQDVLASLITACIRM